MNLKNYYFLIDDNNKKIRFDDGREFQLIPIPAKRKLARPNYPDLEIDDSLKIGSVPIIKTIVFETKECKKIKKALNKLRKLI